MIVMISDQQNPYIPSQQYYQPSMPMGMYDNAGLGQQFNPIQDIPVGKGKGRLREEDFEAAFAEVAASMTTNSVAETARIVEVPVSATDMLEAAMHNVSVDDTEKLDSSVRYGTDFQTYVIVLMRHRNTLLNHKTEYGIISRIHPCLPLKRMQPDGKLNLTS